MTAFSELQFTDAVQTFRARRRIKHLTAMAIGGFGTYLGAATIGLRYSHHEDETTASMTVGIVIYVIGVVIFAWGGAKGRWSIYPLWLLTTLIVGLLMTIVAAVAAGYPAANASILSAAGDEQALSRATAKQKRQAPGLAEYLVDEARIGVMIGTPLEGPRYLMRRVLRTRSVMDYQGPPRDPSKPELTRPMVWVSVRIASAKGRARMVSFMKRSKSSPLSGVGDEAYQLMRQFRDRYVVGIAAAHNDWIIKISLSDFQYVPGAERALVELITDAFARLDRADSAISAGTGQARAIVKN